ncbi:MAG: hypothetical protein L6Q95_01910 [Planctomycetes bacterium]|nr:hypothetical protein [Planctomycetota bacterium]
MAAEEAAAVEDAIARDPVLASELEDFRALAGLFGHVEPEEVSEGLSKRLYALDAAAPAQGFRLVSVAPAPPRVSWARRALAAAAVVLLAIGVTKLASRPDVVVYDVSRLAVGPDGRLTAVRRVPELTVKAGETLSAEAGERLSFRTAEGDRVTLLPGGALAVGDPRDGEIFDLERGTTLCSVLARDAARTVLAGPYRIRVTREAHFGVRVSEPHVRPAGAATGNAEVTVTVSLGAVEVFRNGDRETVGPCERAVFTARGGTRTHAASDPVYFDLMRVYREHSREIVPGYFTGEPGVAPIPQRWMGQPDGSAVLALSDADEVALRATHLVLKVRASVPGDIRLTRVRPMADRPGEAETATLVIPSVGREWTVVAVRRADFDGPSAGKGVRAVGEDRSRLVRIEASAERARVEVQSSLWAARPPVELSEVVR